MHTDPHNDVSRQIVDLREMPHGEQRAVRLAELLEHDLAALPLGIDPPAAVSEALDAFRVACDWLKQVVANSTAAEHAVSAAAAADVDAAAEALRADKPVPKTLRKPKAADAAAASAVATEAAERVVIEAHERVVDAVRESYLDWRRMLVTKAPSEHASAVQAMRSAATGTAAAVAAYNAVSTLDAQVLSRYPELRHAADSEKRHGLAWYRETHTGRMPLKAVSLPNPRGRGHSTFKLADVLAAVTTALEAPSDFPVADWLPPTDPAHDAALAEPLDLTAPWVRSAVARSFGGDFCAVCRQPGATVVVDGHGIVADGGLCLVHERCQHELGKLDEKEQGRREREQKRRDAVRRAGYPEDPRAGEWRGERDAQAREDAHAAALGGPGGE